MGHDLGSMTVPSAFTLQRAAALSGVSEDQLRAWGRAGFYKAHYESGLYSFRDVVALRTLGILRNERQVSLQSLKKAGVWLTERYEAPWSTLRFGTAGKEFVYYDDDGRPVSVKKLGQRVVEEIPVEKVERSIAREAKKLATRRDDDVGRVAKRRGVQSSAECVAGTGIRTRAIWEFHRQGFTPAQIVKQYPVLTLDDVKAAIEAEQRSHAA